MNDDLRMTRLENKWDKTEELIIRIDERTEFLVGAVKQAQMDEEQNQITRWRVNSIWRIGKWTLVTVGGGLAAAGTWAAQRFFGGG